MPRRGSTEHGTAARRGHEPSARAASKKASKARQESSLMVGSVEKAFRVLAAFDETHPHLSLTQLASLVDMDKSAAQRFSHTLVQLGFLSKDPTTKRFELTSQTLELGYRYSRSNTLVRRARPYLLHLSQQTEETVNLTILSDTNVVFVSRFQSPHMLDTDVTIGTTMPAYASPSGIAILSRLSDAQVNDILSRSDLKPVTPYTKWEKPDLMKQIEAARQFGFASSASSYHMGDVSIAAAIRGPGGRPVGAVSLAVSEARFTTEEAVKKYSGLVVATAHALS